MKLNLFLIFIAFILFITGVSYDKYFLPCYIGIIAIWMITIYRMWLKKN